MKIPYKKWRNEHILFLDDGFECEDARIRLEEAGYKIERFSMHFADENGVRKQGVKDPDIIKLCNQKGWLLVTVDKDIINTHGKLIEQSPNLGILATSHNSVENVMYWTESLVKLKPIIERNSFRKRQRPWFGKFDRNGKFGTPVRYVGKTPRMPEPA